MDLELSLHLNQIRTSLIHIRTFEFQHIIQRLCLQTALRDSEVDKSCSTAHIWRERCRRVSCRKEQLKRRREVNLLLAKLYQDTTTSLLVFLVEHVVENWIQMFGVLDENWVSEPQSTLQLLDEGVVQKACNSEFPFGAFLLQELRDPARRINDERVSVVSLQDDGILRTEIVDRERVLLPSQTLVSV